MTVQVRLYLAQSLSRFAAKLLERGGLLGFLGEPRLYLAQSLSSLVKVFDNLGETEQYQASEETRTKDYPTEGSVTRLGADYPATDRGG